MDGQSFQDYLDARAKRRKQLAKQHDIDPIVGSDMATAYAVVTHPHPAVRKSPKLNGTLYKRLSEHLRGIAGYSHAPKRRIRWLLDQLRSNCPHPIQAYATPIPPVDDTDPGEQIIEIAQRTIARMPFRPPHEARKDAQRALRGLTKLYPYSSGRAQHLKNVLTYIPHQYPPGTPSLVHTPSQGSA